MIGSLILALALAPPPAEPGRWIISDLKGHVGGIPADDVWPNTPGGITVSADTLGPNLALAAPPAPVSSRLGQPHAKGSKTLVLEHGPASARFGRPSPQKPIRVEVTAPAGSRTVYRVGARATNTLLGAEAIEGQDRDYGAGSVVRLLPETEE